MDNCETLPLELKHEGTSDSISALLCRVWVHRSCHYYETVYAHIG